ncbi:MAG: hypothetical protein Ta2B_24140 [Termitinemataceae bacterium]|nr:MAG: hypothetical protein Ta2B_24140 [Termitinemataceae bacterium]
MNKTFLQKLFLVSLFCISGTQLFAKGKAQEIKYKNETWVLCLTEFDVSELPLSKQVVGHLVEKNIILNLEPVDLKLRYPHEFDYYRTYAHLSSKKDAAAKIVAKQAERDKLVYQGLSNFQYESKIKKIDEELATLREAYNDSILVAPQIKREPDFNLKNKIDENIFPSPPKTGAEYTFVKAQSADAFVSGKITEYYNRFYVQIAMWTVDARKYIYTDTVIFSVSDLEIAVAELTNRLIDEITGMKSAGIKIVAAPSEAVIIIGEMYGGHGEAQILNFTPGDVDISVYAKNHETTNETVTLNEDEFLDISVTLTPTPLSQFTIDVQGDESAAVYDGSLYIGRTELTLDGPTDQQRQYNVITNSNKTAQTIFQIKDGAIKLTPIAQPAEGRTEKARRKFYGAFGRFWITLPIFILSNAIYEQNYRETNERSRTAGVLNQNFYDKTVTWQYLTIGFGALAGVFLLESVIRIVVYVYEANKPVNPIYVKPKSDEESSPLGETVTTGASTPETMSETEDTEKTEKAEE